MKPHDMQFGCEQLTDASPAHRSVWSVTSNYPKSTKACSVYVWFHVFTMTYAAPEVRLSAKGCKQTWAEWGEWRNPHGASIVRSDRSSSAFLQLGLHRPRFNSVATNIKHPFPHYLQIATNRVCVDLSTYGCRFKFPARRKLDFFIPWVSLSLNLQGSHPDLHRTDTDSALFCFVMLSDSAACGWDRHS